MDAETRDDVRLEAVLTRLETVLHEENRRIGRDVDFDLKASNAAKSRCLYDLTQIARAVDNQSFSATAARRLEAAKGLLVENERKVGAHVAAVRAVSDLIKDAMREAEADGTYSAEQYRYAEF
ncbi:hypothetical protein [Pararhizobium mangrovi]|uniref:Flagellar protein FlgN n=1 Tax=Pararhizobium mangrovi TaxID=2590452 RepID=A0A506TXX3_9HYPH|nr:hypothetical protein [Pararhizobium mangrovi]TPW26912.1 hypothetical protein FJU11_13135 [Pararhizobium mangrovi]